VRTEFDHELDEAGRDLGEYPPQFADYAEYNRLGLPIGSGVTEAACETIFTQRLKLSGMQWTRPGAQVILQLRIVLLSGIWDECYRAFVASHTGSHIEVHGESRPANKNSPRKARRERIAPLPSRS